MILIDMQSRIPYRNSKLTRILQDALGGQSVGLLICNLAPSTKFRQDTLNTLKFVNLLLLFPLCTKIVVQLRRAHQERRKQARHQRARHPTSTETAFRRCCSQGTPWACCQHPHWSSAANPYACER
jgi:hypothetical protein